MNKPYSIDFTTNTITVTKKFLEQASMMGSEAFNIMMQLRQMNMIIITKAPAKRKNAQLTYSKMEKFISLLEEADKYKAEFAAVKNESTAQNMPYVYVQKWFLEHYANYSAQPKFDGDGFVIVKTKREMEAEVEDQD